MSLINLGSVAWMQGDYGSARTALEESLIICREMGDGRGISDSLEKLGRISNILGDPAIAQTHQVESLIIRGEIGDRARIAYSLESFAGLAFKNGKSEQAVALWGAAVSLREEIDSPLRPNEREAYDRDVAAVRQVLGEDVFSKAWANGRAMTLEEAKALALDGSDV